MKIVELAETAQNYLITVDNLSREKRNADDIKATYTTLQNVLNLAQEVNDLSALFQDRLKIGDIREVELPKILKEAQALELKFISGQQWWQVKELRQNIMAPLDRLKSKIASEWKRDAENQLRPYFELLNMAHMLPELREKEAVINGLTERLRHYVSVMPSTQKELDSFDAYFHQLQTHLSQLHSLHPEVRDFLQKTYNNQATMLDVTDKVLQWCRQGEHAKIFHITFTH